MPAGKGKRRPGRPPGAKNKPKPAVIAPEPQWATYPTNGVRKRAPAKASFLQVNPKHLKLIQKWSNETKIGMQQIFDDIFLAGSSAAYKSFYRGLINSRRAAEAQFDAETNTEGLVDKTARGAEQVNRLSDPRSPGPAPRPREDDDEELSSLAAVRPGQLEETSADIEDSFGIADAAPVEVPLPDAPPESPAPEEEEPEPPEETGEPPY